ncbi:hypothetical protein SAMN04487895_103116 [Paenibacillus sophorae]|uniref:DUF4179 domain-containing protein n=1 Tax=Paenibacillus sophorae TaxID=1333845 RepID=A0A1H8JR74_9BACL|nr:hypothetical protein [Paenibacillus sophorae]QWU13451.1 hypothetical protein KP014_15745 [Paenibacillus sophorae]SEN83005.1 hypothetical protein SAMN04487895_103116 [Paenibacillus sophorae]
MFEREEKLARDYFHAADRQSSPVSEQKLDAAIHAGIAEGTRRGKNVRRRYAFTTAVILTVALLFIISWLGGLGGQKIIAVQPKNWGEFEAYRSIAENNITIKTALDAGLVIPLHISTQEKNGYKIILDGMIADRRGMLLLYTFENRSAQKATVTRFSLKGPSNFSSTSYWSGGDRSPGITHNYVQLTLEEGQKLSERITAEVIVIPDTPEAQLSSSNKFRTSLTTGFTVDTAEIEKSGREIDIGETMTVGGQRIHIEKAYIGPTGIYLNAVYDDQNAKRIFSVIKPTIMSGKGEKETALASYMTLDVNTPLQTMVFHNNNMDAKGPLKLTIKGIQALDKPDLKLVIDTEAQKIIKAPDDRLTLSDRSTDIRFTESSSGVEGKGKPGQLVLQLSTKPTPNDEMTRVSFDLDDSFTDGEGVKHSINRNEGTYWESSGNSEGWTDTGIYNLGSAKLPQPLTFTISSYPNPILEEKTVRIR